MRKRGRHPLRPVITVIVCVFLLSAFLLSMRRFGADTRKRQTESLTRAMQRDIAECYATEGFYPPSLQYLKDYYGLTYDENFFFVDYRPLGGNLYPDYYIGMIGAQPDE